MRLRISTPRPTTSSAQNVFSLGDDSMCIDSNVPPHRPQDRERFKDMSKRYKRAFTGGESRQDAGLIHRGARTFCRRANPVHLHRQEPLIRKRMAEWQERARLI